LLSPTNSLGDSPDVHNRYRYLRDRYDDTTTIVIDLKSLPVRGGGGEAAVVVVVLWFRICWLTNDNGEARVLERTTLATLNAGFIAPSSLDFGWPAVDVSGAQFMAQMSVGSSFLADFLFTKSPAFVLVFFLVCAALACYVVLLLASTEDVKTKLLAMPTASLHFFLSKDRKWKQPSDTRIILEEARAFPERAHRKRIIFLRHGESMWNVVFNKGFGPSFPVRLVKCSVKEAELLPTADSLYWDSPISPDGIQQSLRLLSWIEENKKTNKYARLLAGDDQEHTSIMASSNLRRAVSTGMIALSARLLRGEEAPSAGGHRQEQIYVMSALQEVTRNVDGFALTPKKGVPGPSFVEVADPKIKDVVDFYAEHKLNGTFNDGSKPLSSNGLARFREFCDWCFNSSVARDVDCVVAIGHSLYFR
ncbi:hypothetical protein FOZ63_002425, partial [Perkinsus olseni]